MRRELLCNLSEIDATFDEIDVYYDWDDGNYDIEVDIGMVRATVTFSLEEADALAKVLLDHIKKRIGEPETEEHSDE